MEESWFMIDAMIRDHTADFGILDCMHLEKIPQKIKTSFSWSQKPNSACLAMNKKYYCQAIENDNIRLIVADPNAFDPEIFLQDTAVIIAQRADEFFYFLHNYEIHRHQNQKSNQGSSIADSACIAPTAILGDNVVIGENVVIHHGCLISDNTVIGSNTVLHPNVTIGTEGFFSKYILGKKTHIKHYGGVRIGANCIVHTGTNISRSVNYDENTELGDNVHIGIHSNIGHDCKVQEGTDISAQVVLAGRVQVGKNCWLGAGVIVSNALSIGDRAIIRIGAVVIENVPVEAEVSGNFAMHHQANLRNYLKAKRK